MTAKKPPRRHIIVLYGLPGAGKSSLARHIGEHCPGYFFADVASHPLFGEQPMHLCATDLYRAGGRGRHLVTEGVLRTPEVRNRFARNVHKTLSTDKRYIFRVPRLVLVNERPETLSSRRPARGLAGYEAMMSDFLVGSGQYPHAVLDGERFDSLEARAAWLLDQLPAMTPDNIDAPSSVADLAALSPAQDGDDGHAPGDPGEREP